MYDFELLLYVGQCILQSVTDYQSIEVVFIYWVAQCLLLDIVFPNIIMVHPYAKQAYNN